MTIYAAQFGGNEHLDTWAFMLNDSLARVGHLGKRTADVSAAIHTILVDSADTNVDPVRLIVAEGGTFDVVLPPAVSIGGSIGRVFHVICGTGAAGVVIEPSATMTVHGDLPGVNTAARTLAAVGNMISYVYVADPGGIGDWAMLSKNF